MPNDSNLTAAARFVDFGLSEKIRGLRESASGPGSSLKSAAAAAKMMSRVMNEFPVRSVLDLGCGDWNWMQFMGFPYPVPNRKISYEGWEASETLVADLKSKFECDGVEFHLRDVSSSDFPDVDLIIARDILFHMPVDMAEKVAKKIRNSCQYLLAPSFLNVRENKSFGSYLEIENWGFFLINMNVEPFAFADCLRECVLEPECASKEQKRYFCFYDFSLAEGVSAEPSLLQDSRRATTEQARHLCSPQLVADIPEVSVIVTAYNNADVVQTAIESIAKQSVDDLEIIVLDDRSTDDTWRRIEDAAHLESRIVPLKSSYNRGPSAMRNIGISQARGEYLFFVDGDDQLYQDALLRILERAASTSADVVRGSHVIATENQNRINVPEHQHQPEVFRTHYADMPSLVQLYTSWNTLIRKRVVHEAGIKFRPDVRLGEDRIFNQHIFNAARHISLMKLSTYQWNMKRKSGEHLSHGIHISERLRSITMFLATIDSLKNATFVHRKMAHASMAFEIAVLAQRIARDKQATIEEKSNLDDLWLSIEIDEEILRDQSLKGWDPQFLDIIREHAGGVKLMNANRDEC